MSRHLTPVVLLVIAAAAVPQPAPKDASKAIEQQLRSLRSLPDDVRANTTRKLAAQIRALPGPDKLPLAVALSNLSTEGDFGSATLQQVADTLAEAIRETHPVADDAYAELARIVHYEHTNTSLDDPKFAAAIAKLNEDDRIRQESDFSLQDLTGKTWTLKQLKGSVVLVNFWATWCPPCRKEMPDLEKLSRQFAGEGLIVLAISDEAPSKIKPFIAAGKYTYLILLDPEGAVNQRFRIQGIPKSLVYDRSGKLMAQSADMRTMGQFREMLRQAGLP